MSSMWSHMFALDLPVTEKLVRAVAIYLFLVVALRIVGKRELGQLNTLDFVVLLAVANAVQNGLIGPDNSVTGAVLGATVLFVVNSALAFVLFRQRSLRRLLEGSPTPLIEDGQVLTDNLRRQEMSRDDLLVEIQSAGASSVDDVRTAKLMPSGRVVVIPKDPNSAAEQYAELCRRLDELASAVAALRADPGVR